ncbi:T9SS type A sorting domain-containing protein [Dyadobacter aurulentus]|uniref:T9SS type A sorting domain-containing protein n=1 Tax=Dyadobacter sp. UC 10 TaxID=2605428 RepID=UPI0011F2EFD7|nr:T9SS type A sorting domain-containing protein [Dyadobacter sp. UC 10]KAA0992736.1 T9SS type A sorting domain-containing protein [Dyadobacter sp. UC 10]
MKRYLLFCQLALLPSVAAFGQFAAGSVGFHVVENTQVAIDGLTLNPTADFTIASRTLTISPTPISGSPASIAKVYNFNEPVNFVGNVGFFFLPAQLNGNTESTLQLSYGTASFVTTLNSFVDVNQHYVANDLPVLTSFASVTAAQEGALPVMLVSFDVTKAENEAVLQWQTTSEVNSSFFEIQQSNDAKRWNILGSVESAANSKTLKRYSFKDVLRSGTNYYRLKMVDLDGSFAYSAIRNLRNEHSEMVTAYPNPVEDKLQVDISKLQEAASISVFDISGREFYKSSRLQPVSDVDMQEFPSGTYLIQVKKRDGGSETVKVVKQ